MSIFANVLRRMSLNVNGPWLLMPAPDGFHVASIGVSAALATGAPANSAAADSAAKKLRNCIGVSFQLLSLKKIHGRGLLLQFLPSKGADCFVAAMTVRRENSD